MPKCQRCEAEGDMTEDMIRRSVKFDLFYLLMRTSRTLCVRNPRTIQSCRQCHRSSLTDALPVPDDDMKLVKAARLCALRSFSRFEQADRLLSSILEATPS